MHGKSDLISSSKKHQIRTMDYTDFTSTNRHAQLQALGKSESSGSGNSGECSICLGNVRVSTAAVFEGDASADSSSSPANLCSLPLAHMYGITSAFAHCWKVEIAPGHNFNAQIVGL